MLNHLKALQQTGTLQALDVQFAALIHSLEPHPLLTLMAAQVSAELGRGNVCVDLTELADLPAELIAATGVPIQQWTTALAQCVSVGDGREPTPLVLDDNRLYLYRYWQYEFDVGAFLVAARPINVPWQQAEPTLARLFPVSEAIDWQKVAVALAATQTFSVISGGPGTGKTTTVTRLLALLTELGGDPIIKLVAPTGKAAARLTGSIASAISALNCDDAIKAKIPTEASTLHRLLGVTYRGNHFIHNRKNRLNLDILVVDEASMIDLPMMSQLIEALPDHARLILLGDKDQLSSVETGSVLGDICRSASSGYSAQQAALLSQLTGFTVLAGEHSQADGLGDHFCLLRKSYRFDAHSGIGFLAAAINEGHGHKIPELLDGRFSDIELLPHVDDASYQQMVSLAVQGYSGYLQQVQAGAAPQAILDSFNRFQLLCALREGPFGVSGLNNAVETALTRRNLIEPDGHWYQGRPVLITRNDPNLGLYNGDIGIALKDDNRRLKVYFDLPEKGIYAVLPSRLPAHETVYAMTIHKSQGSEFDNVLMVLGNQVSITHSRELVYTGITRAKKQLTLFSTLPVLNYASSHPTVRQSGLLNRLSGNAVPPLITQPELF